MTIVAPQSCNVKWMNQLRQRRISCALEHRGGGSEFFLVYLSIENTFIRNKNARCAQQSFCIRRN